MIINVYVKTNARDNEFVEVIEDLFVIKLKARPVGGAANRELLKYLSSKLGVAKSSLEIVKGLKSKHKKIEVKNNFTFTEILEKVKGE
ncbi:MAG: DUF167 domain-containing protein [Deferribacterota bacterium]|nr:DUF167 domain-containing protein [Deferribacterota bacterium]